MAKKTPMREQELRQKIVALKQTGKLPSRTPKIIADQLNQIPRTTPITRNLVSQTLAGRCGNLEIIEAIIALAERNATEQLIRRLNHLLHSPKRRRIRSLGILLPFLFAFFTTHAQTDFQPENYPRITNAVSQLTQLQQCAVRQIIPDKYCYQGQPTRLRITEVESIFGYTDIPLAQRTPLETHIYFRPATAKNADEVYLFNRGHTRMLAASILVQHPGEYWLTLYRTGQLIGTLYYNTTAKTQAVEIRRCE